MTTPVYTPTGLPYPITIDELIPDIGSNINKGDRLFAYKFWYMVEIAQSPDDNDPADSTTQDNSKKKSIRESIEFVESPFEGTLMSWNVDVGDEIVKPGISICDIKRPCNHDVVYNGLCTICGKEVDENEINALNGGAPPGDLQPNLAVVSHMDSNLKISKREATNLDTELVTRLQHDKKLILVVDLDQTVIHCGVDPTIGEWKNDPKNPNYETLKDVRQFSLDEEPILPFMYMGEKKPPMRKCWYYVKVRPGLKEFFNKLAPMFEMYIYTMATRAYALEIAKIIDPNGDLFGDRILSRDENGSLTQKSLERLFPTDQSMVIIIDDRGDVWNWSDNLIKVIPYNFFLGVGDINSNFLPKQQTTMLQLGRRSRENKPKQIESLDKNDISTDSESDEVEAEKSDKLLDDIMDTEKQLKEKINEEVKRQEAQLNKNVATKEEQNQQASNQAKEEWTKKLQYSASVEVQQKNRPLATLQSHLHDQRLLVDDDDELYYLKDTLAMIHDKYYSLLKDHPEEANIKKIMPELKSKVFQDCHFVFSGLIPLNTNIQKADIVMWTNVFGAETTTDIDEYTTHVITKTPGTYKARLAVAFNPDIKVVHPDWIFECLISWKKVDEKPYKLIVEQPVGDQELQDYKDKLEKLEEKREEEEELVLLKRSKLDSEESNNMAGNLFGSGTSWLDEDEEDIPDDEDEDESGDDDEANTTVLDDVDSAQIDNKRPLLMLDGLTKTTDPSLKKLKTEDDSSNKENESDESDLDEELLNMLDS
ncbi:Carboxy-terminal domain (CTD) phosphatase [Monosporozyma unispora]|nr:Carboxy-terminal domain (CTD) phosphatase [Kazachstania unispora]